MKKSFWSNFESNIDRPTLLTVIGIILALSALIIFGGVINSAANKNLIGIFAILLTGVMIAVARGYLTVGKITTPLFVFTLITTLAYRAGILDSSILGYAGAILISGYLLGQFGGLGMGLLSIIAIIIIGTSEITGFNNTNLQSYVLPEDILTESALLLGITLLQWRLAQSLSKSLQNARDSEQAQIAANEELRILQNTLEKRITDRTAAVEESALQIQKRAAQLEAISDVSRSIANIQDLDQLLPAITRFISDRFGFYHVGVFLLDETREFALLRAANSAGGQKMLQREHKLQVESSSLVGYAASRGRPRIALDVGFDAVFFKNPDLPETRSEIALPLISGEQVIGVLDVQSQEESAFSQEDATVLGALANQIAIALENARLFAETRRALAEAERTYQQYLAAGWRRAAQKAPHLGYESSAPGKVAPLSQPLQMQIETAVPGGKALTKSEAAAGLLSVPIKVRGEVIGILNVSANEPDRAWNVDELTLVNAVAERAAFALENARLVDDAQRRAAKERLIGEIANKIAGASSIESIIETAARELGVAMNSADVTIQFQENQK